MLRIKEFLASIEAMQNKLLIIERDRLSVKISEYASELRDMIGEKTIIELEINKRGMRINKHEE